MKKYKIFIIGKLPPPYMGTAIWTEVVLNSTIKNHFDIFHYDTRVSKSLQDIGRTSIQKLFAYFKLYKRLLPIIKKVKPDLTLIPLSQSTTGFIKDSILLLIASKNSNKIVLYLHGSNFKNVYDESSLISKAYFRFILSLGSAVIVLGNKLKQIFYDFFESEKIFVVPNGSNYNFPQRTKTKSKLKLLYLGNLQSSKGIEDVVIAIKCMSINLRASIQLNVIGEWRDENTKSICLNITESNSLPIKFFNPMYDETKLQEFINSDIFIFPPRNPEGHPWVIVEAMAAGLPIISTDKGAITESVIDGVNGFIVEPNNPKQIAEKLEFLINNEELRIKMGRESRRLYEEKFTEAKMVESLINVFNTVLN